ncbi:hypothetical protein EJB05_02544, partial [Eragrostis curvula]
MAAAASSDRAEVDTSRAFRSVKEAVAVFGERILAREAAQFRPNAAAHGDRLKITEKNPRSKTVTIAAPRAKLEVSDGVPASGILTRESHSKASASYSVKQGGSNSSNNPVPDLLPAPMTRPAAPDDVPMYLVPSSPPFFASSPSLANDEFDDEEREREDAADLMVMSSIRKLEDEAARTRQDVAQLKKRIAEMELSMATLNAKLHRALSKIAHMEADKAAAERAAIERGGRGHGDMALALWAERRGQSGGGGRPPLGHLMRFGGGGDADGGEAPPVAGGGGQLEMARPPARRKVQKQKPIVPLVFPLIGGVLFSKKKRMKDKESIYMKELYNLLRLT